MSSLYLVDDHALMRDGLRALLEQAGHRVVGESDDIETALGEIRTLLPDVLLLDIQLGERSGLELLERMQRHQVATRTIVLTVHAQPRYLTEAQRLGAEGYVLKGAPSGELLAAVLRVHLGDRHWGADVQQLLVSQQGQEQGATAALSARERQIVLLVVQGYSSAAVGERLHLSPKTIDTYRSRLMAKLGVADLPALVRLAIRDGLIGLDGI